MIYAVDFDGTLCDDKYPEIGDPNTPLIEFLIGEKENGAELILWTMREGETLEQAVTWCKERGLEFDTVNDNLARMKEKYKNNPRKVYADRYIDDHNYTPICAIDTDILRRFTGELYLERLQSQIAVDPVKDAIDRICNIMTVENWRRLGVTEMSRTHGIKVSYI